MMIAGRLRRAVLQAAISGQLTEQCTAGGDARDLLAAIRAEKARRVRAGELKKERPLPPVTPEEQPFALPANWCWARLGDVSLKIHYGYTASAQKSGNVKLLRITDIQNNHVTWPDVPFCTVAAKGLADYGLHNRDIVIARTGGTIGKSYIVRELAEPAVFASYLIRVIPCEQVNEEYLKLFMESPFYWQQLEAKSQGTGQPNVNGKALSNLVVPLPPFEEQKRIVAFLQPTFNELANLEADERQLEALATAFPGRLQASLLQAAISGRLTERQAGDGDARDLLADIQRERQRLVREKKLKKEKPLPPVTDEEVPFELPENWCWCRFSDIFQVARGGSPRPIKQYLTDAPNGINWIKIGDTDIGGKYILTTRERIIPEGVKHSRMVHSGDLLLTNSMSYGRPYILKTDGCIHDGWLVLSPFSDGIDKDFFFYLISAPYIQRAFINLVAGGVVKNLNKDRVKQILLPLPPLVEQKRIVARLEELLPLCGELEQG